MTIKTEDMSEQASVTPQPQGEAATAVTSEIPHDHSHATPKGNRALFIVALSALGVVYGDIGTSPLYALRECFHGIHAIAPTSANIFGVLSLIFWALIIVITLKYIIFILQADNHGEGGILVLTALATPIRRLERNPRRWLVLIGVFGTALLYGDGVITPAISVLSAVEGLKIAAPGLGPYVIPLTLAIIVGLFMIQSRGTARIGRIFGPVMLIWFATLALLGIINIVQYPAVFQAINPLYAVTFFSANGWTGFLILGTVFLVVTGGEALYADMGHFGSQPIRLAWFTLVLPALLLNYFGQGALLLNTPEAAENSFYLMAPSWALYPLVVLATLATIIASQALISGAFSITMQAENLGFLPRMKILHTSPIAYGQIYIPFVNWALMLACIAVVIGFQTSGNLAAAYGIAVTTTMVITTIIFGVVTLERWRWNPLLVIGVVGFFLIIDSAFLGANLVKIPNGGWFPLVVAALIFIVMTTWKRGSTLVFTYEQDMEMSLEELLKRLRENPPARTPGLAVFLSANPDSAPAALLANLKYNGVLHERTILTTVHSEEAPRIPETERVSVEPLGQGFYRVIVHYGFMEEPDVPEALACLDPAKLDFNPEQVPYFVNRTRAIATNKPGMALWREHLYTVLRQNAASASDFFCLPATQVFEISTSVEV
jgi:KUP system potassium uptake protein